MIRWVLVPLLGAFIGWITNVVAIRLLFRPLKPHRFLFWTLQGLLPRRRDELASQIATVLDRDLLPWEEVATRLQAVAQEGKLVELLGETVRNYTVGRLPAFLPLGWREAIGNAAEEIARREAPLLWKRIQEELQLNLRNVSLGHIVKEKLENLDLEQLEALVLQVASKELRYIELLGGLLGLVIGFLQALLGSW